MAYDEQVPRPTEKRKVSRNDPTDSSHWERAKYSKLGSYLLSFDFYLGVPLGIGAGLLLAYTSEGRSVAPTALLGIGAVGAGVATLMLTALSVLVASVTPEYARVLRKTPGGVGEVASPFKAVVVLACLTTVCSLVGVALVPIVSHLVWWITGIVVIPAFSFAFWSVLGCVQVAGQLVYHFEMRDKFHENEEKKKSFQQDLNRP